MGVINETPNNDTSGYDNYYTPINNLLSIPGSNIGNVAVNGTTQAYRHAEELGENDYDTFQTRLTEGESYRVIFTPDNQEYFNSNVSIWEQDPSGQDADLILNAIGSSTTYINGALYSDVFSVAETGRHYFSIFSNNFYGALNVADSGYTISLQRIGPSILRGDARANNLAGDSGQNIIYGFGGNDTLKGLGGNDELRAGTGHDLAVGHGGNDALWGGDGNDRLYGSQGNDSIQGGNGHDTIGGGSGADVLNGGAGNDTLSYANAGLGVTVGLWNNSTARGDAAGDSINNFENVIGGNGRDRLTGDSADNLILGGGRADTLNGGAGNDTLSYADAEAGVTVGLWNGSAARGDAAGDVISNFENVIGGNGRDRLTGDAGVNILVGNAGSDTLNGGAGADKLTGGAGKDFLQGGTNDGARDVFIFNTIGHSVRGADRDVIIDFDAGIDDIYLAQIDANSTAAGNQAFAWSGTTAHAHSLWTVQLGENSLVRGDVNGDGRFDFEIEVQDVTDLSVNDFIL